MPKTRELQRREGDYIGPQSVLHKRKKQKKTSPSMLYETLTANNALQIFHSG